MSNFRVHSRRNTASSGIGNWFFYLWCMTCSKKGSWLFSPVFVGIGLLLRYFKAFVSSHRVIYNLFLSVHKSLIFSFAIAIIRKLTKFS